MDIYNDFVRNELTNNIRVSSSDESLNHQPTESISVSINQQPSKNLITNDMIKNKKSIKSAFYKMFSQRKKS